MADRLGLSAAEIQKVLMGMGVLAALNQRLAGDAVNRIAAKLGPHGSRRHGFSGLRARVRSLGERAESQPNGSARLQRDGRQRESNGAARPGTAGGAKPARQAVAVSGRAATDLVTRPPVVTIMGHVRPRQDDASRHDS